MFNFTRALIRQTKNNIGKYSSLKTINAYSSAPTAELKTVTTENNPPVIKTKVIKSNNSIVAAAFASLSKENNAQSDTKTPFTDGRIESATNIDELLSISDGSGISRRHALKVVSILADWSSNGKVKLTDFESDNRFVKLCKVLTKNSKRIIPPVQTRHDDLSMIMNVAADDEAAKLVATITLPQMVKVIQTLAAKKRRSMPLLRSLAYNITKDPHKLDLKQSADLLYSMCTLNFPDPNLLEKISADILQGFAVNTKKSAVIGSIITSLGILKYKDTSGMLDALCAWVLDNYATCRVQDLFAMFLTLGVLNYQPPNADKLYTTITPHLSRQEAQKANVWLDYVWALVIVNRASQEQLDSVLTQEFVDKCDGIPARIKLLHLNGASDGKGVKLMDGDIFETAVTRTKEKDEMIVSVLDTLKNLMKNDVYIKSYVNTNMGFFIDAECIIDKKCLPVAQDKYNKEAGHVRVAIMVQDYHDMCRGRVEPAGTCILQQRLLEKLGYKVIQVPFYEYRPRDKLIHRVQLIESKLKAAAAATSRVE